MSEVGELYAALRAESQARRAANRVKSTEKLVAAGVEFVTYNNGVHLILQAGRIEFWPSTGLWRVRGDTKRHRGVRELIKFIREGK